MLSTSKALCGKAACNSDDCNPQTKSFFLPLVHGFNSNDRLLEELPSLKIIRSENVTLNLFYFADCQQFKDDKDRTYRKLVSINIMCVVKQRLLSYFFLIAPDYQIITKDGGKVSLNLILSDVLNDLRCNYLKELPHIKKKDIIYKKQNSKRGLKKMDYDKMKDIVIPITIICDNTLANLSALRRTSYDTKILERLEIHNIHATSNGSIHFKVKSDNSSNYYYITKIHVRDMRGLQTQKIIKDNQYKNERIIPRRYNGNSFINLKSSPYEYYMRVSRLLRDNVDYCSQLFRPNREIPYSLAKQAERNLKSAIIEDYNIDISNKKVDVECEYNKKYRGLEKTDGGKLRPIKSNPDVMIVQHFFKEAFIGGYNGCDKRGWEGRVTHDYDIVNAYPTAMLMIKKINWGTPILRHITDRYITLDDLDNSPLTPAAALGNYKFSEEVSHPNIPTPSSIKDYAIYPLEADNVIMDGATMYNALRLGAEIKVKDMYVLEVLDNDGSGENVYFEVISQLLYDRKIAKKTYSSDVFSAILKDLANEMSGKIQQGISPKSKSEISTASNAYAACYITSLVRNFLIATINDIEKHGKKTISELTDGFITDADIDLIEKLDSYGFSAIFRNAKNAISDKYHDSELKTLWVEKHTNEELLNCATRLAVASNKEGVITHNQYSTGETKDSMKDRNKLIDDVLTRRGKLQTQKKERTDYIDIIEKKRDYIEEVGKRSVNMEFDFKRCPILWSAKEVEVVHNNKHYKVLNFDTRPYKNVEEFERWKEAAQNCINGGNIIESVEALNRLAEVVRLSSYGVDVSYNNVYKKELMSIIYKHYVGEINIPLFDDMTWAEIIDTINSWNIEKISMGDVKEYCYRNEERKPKILPDNVLQEMINHILDLCKEV